MGEILRWTSLDSGKFVTIEKSDKSSLPPEALHVIANVADRVLYAEDRKVFEHNELTQNDIITAMDVLMTFLENKHPDGKWNLALPFGPLSTFMGDCRQARASSYGLSLTLLHSCRS